MISLAKRALTKSKLKKNFLIQRLLRYNNLYKNYNKGAGIKESFSQFYKNFSRNEIERAIEFFACFGGSERFFEVDFTLDLIDNITKLLHNYEDIQEKLATNSDHLLAAFAIGDRKIESAIKKSFIDEPTGYKALHSLMKQNYINKEYSREKPPQKSHPKQKLKKALRRYRIQHKVRFNKPFLRFWYRYIYSNEELIFTSKFDTLISNILDDLENFVSLTFEELSMELLKERFKKIKSIGSYWDKNIELDILLELTDGKKIVGECKWKNSKICKKTLNSLQKKSAIAKIDPDYYALFSKSSFSNELLKNRPPNILLFDLEDFKEWSEESAYRKKEKTPYSYEF